jgi:hypothetical protein
MKQPSRKRVLRRVGVSSAIAVTVLAGGVGVASASTYPLKSAPPAATSGSNDAGTTSPPPMPPRGPGGVGGDVTALTDASITVVTPDGTANTYTINSSTVITDRRQVATAASLALGENVLVTASTADASVAASIDIEPAVIAGRVSAVSGDTITVTGPNDATGSIDVSSTTTYSKSGASASLSDVSVGSFVFAQGTFGSSPTTIDAATVGIGSPGPGSGPGDGPGPGPGPGSGPGNGPGPGQIGTGYSGVVPGPVPELRTSPTAKGAVTK